MATVNLGAIKFNWKGAYAGGTAYVADDVVSYLGSSYVCILASTGNVPTNGTYFEQMSSAGTNGTDGTDLTTTLTTQGDILYRDGSGLQRLGAGTSGQALITGGTGANPSWGDASGGKVLQVVSAVKTSESSTTSSSYVSTGLSASITPSATSSKIFILTSNPVYQNSASQWIQNTIYKGSSNLSSGGDGFAGARNNGSSIGCSLVCSFLDSPSTTSSTTYTLYHKVEGGGGTGYAAINNWNAVITLMEIGA